VNARTRIQAKATPPLIFMPMWTGLLQRKCACGGSSGFTGECAECTNKRLQRSSCGSSGKRTGNWPAAGAASAPVAALLAVREEPAYAAFAAAGSWSL